MSKTSARSKGYRKVKKQKKGYTPQEIRTMIIGFAVIVVVVIGVLVVPDFIESFHLLKVKDGVVQGVEDNWLVCNTGTSSHKKYRKLGETEPVEGYELDSIEDGYSDANLRYFNYTPTSDDAVAQKLIIQPGNGEASELVETYKTQIGTFGETLYVGDVLEETVNDVNTYTVVVEYRAEDYSEAIEEAEAEAAAEDEAAEDAAEDETAEAPAEDATEDEAADEVVYEYNQSVVLYIESPIDGKCIVVSALNSGADESAFADRDAMIELVRQQAACITLAE